MALKIQGTTVYDDNKIVLPNNSSEISKNTSISSNTLTLDLYSATVFTVSLNAAINTITIQNVQSTGRSSSFVLMFIANGSPYAVTWPTSFLWPGGTAPTLTTTNGKKDVFTFFTVDGGTTWESFITGQNI
jgi:hypothetical protein